MNGIGTLYYHDGNKYEGNFKNNVINGSGTFYTKNGEKSYIFVKDGKIIKSIMVLNKKFKK